MRALPVHLIAVAIISVTSCSPSSSNSNGTGTSDVSWSIDQVVNSLTSPDIGVSGRTVRFVSNSVGVYADFNIPSGTLSPSWVDPNLEIERILDWLSRATAVNFHRSSSPNSSITDGTWDRPFSGQVRATGEGPQGAIVNGKLHRSEVLVTCCWRRLLWEEILQAVGVFGDNGPPNSLFSEIGAERTNTIAGEFEFAAIRILYSLPAGSTAQDGEFERSTHFCWSWGRVFSALASAHLHSPSPAII